MRKTTAAVKKIAARPAAKKTAKPVSREGRQPVAKAAKPKTPKTLPARSTSKPNEKLAASPVTPAKPAASIDTKPPKAAKTKLVRDSFTIPKAEYAVIDLLKQRGTSLAHPVKKSELLRAGIKALAALDDAGFLAAVNAVPSIKTGRPKARKPAAGGAGTPPVPGKLRSVKPQ